MNEIKELTDLHPDVFRIYAGLDDPWMRSVSLRCYAATPTKTSVALPLTMQEIQEGQLFEPFVRLKCEQAQELMDSLWQCGIRPTEGAGSAGAMRAVEKHLQDMRKIVASKLKVDL